MDCIMIGIAGGTGSGKSTFTNRLKDRFGDEITVLYHDNYYKRHDDLPFEERKKLNYDHPDALETDLLVEHLKKLRNGESIECPVYDYSRHNRSDQTIRVEPRRIIVIEGILLLADPRIRDLLDIKSTWRQMQMSAFFAGSCAMSRSGEEILTISWSSI